MYLYFHPATVLSCRLTFGRSVAKHSFFRQGYLRSKGQELSESKQREA